MKLELNLNSEPFSLDTTLLCGQLFRWRKLGCWWYGNVDERVFRIRQTGNTLGFEGVHSSFVRDYFRLGDDLPHITSTINHDAFIARAIHEFEGLRIVRQPVWECLISYICATYKNIPAIQDMILRLSKRFGNEVTFDDGLFHTFPEPSRLANATLDELRSCGLGFRAKRVLEAARMVVNRAVDIEALKELDYGSAKHELFRFPGVGNKAADCILLFSLEKLEAFPVDVWIKRVIQNQYANHFNAPFIHKISTKNSLSKREYNSIGSFARNYFGEYAGYAQEYLFHLVRKNRVVVGA